MKRKLLSATLCLLAAVVWGSAFSAQEIASYNADKIDAFFFGGIRFTLGGIALIPLWFIFEKNTDLPKEEKKVKYKNTVIFGIITGFVLFCASSFQQFGIQITQASGKAGFITGLYLVFVPIISLALFKRKASPLVWIAVVFSAFGLYFLCMNGGKFTFQSGDILLFIGAIFFAGHIIVIDVFNDKVSTLRYCTVQFVAVGVFNIIMGIFFGHITWEGFVACIGPILYCGLMSTGVAYTCQIIGQKFTPPTIAALLFSTEGFFSVVFESIIEKTIPSSTMLIGCALMLVGVILSQLPADIFKKVKNAKCEAQDNK